jgi:hypothetical protein
MGDKMLEKNIHTGDRAEIAMVSFRIGAVIHKTVVEIFQAHRSELLSEPFDYVIGAVWCPETNGELSLVQKEISSRVRATLDQARLIFMDMNLDGPQRFALDYLVRSLISTQIMFVTTLSANERDKCPSFAQWPDEAPLFLM